MAERKFGNRILTAYDGNNRENIANRGKTATQRVTRSTLGDIGNVGALKDCKVVTRAQKQLNVYTRKPLHRSKDSSHQHNPDSKNPVPKENDEPKENAGIKGAEVTEPMDMDSAQDVVDQVSKAMKYCNITDIDADDYENPQLCAEYANEIYQYLLTYEKTFIVSDYMKKQKHINERMRSILVDWLVQVHEKFRLLQETLHLTITFVDRYLEKTTVPRSELQLVGVTAMLLASKYEEMFAPEIGDFVYITDEAYDKATIRKTEAEMCNALGYEFGNPLCLHFLRRNSKAADATPEVHTMAKYFMELMLVDYQCVKFLPSMKASSALWLSLKLLDEKHWTATLEHYSSYLEHDLKPCIHRIAELVMKANHVGSKLSAVRNKFAKHKFLRISQAACLSSDKLARFANQW